MQSGSKMAARVSRAGLSLYTGNELSVEATKMLLSQHQGGSVQLSKNDTTGIATLCLNRPDKKNAINGQLLLELDKATSELETWQGGKGVILYGANSTFSSGGDLDMSRATSTAEQGFAIAKFVQKLTTRFRSLPLISVALIEGVALGGGAELAVAACDWRIMTDTAKIGFVHARMGLTPGWGGGVALRKLLGASTALELVISAKVVTASEALNIGLTNAMIPSEAGLEHAQNWLIKQLQDVPNDVLHANKIAMTSEEYQLQLDTELRIHAPLWGGEAKIQALARNIKHVK